jgi:hypothetical protein
MPFIGAFISAFLIACSLTRLMSFRDLFAHHGDSSISCQWGICSGGFHRAVMSITAIELKTAIILFSMSSRWIFVRADQLGEVALFPGLIVIAKV